ncbi:hypothetical protein D918_09445 [Trichuris suis]|nr:hypothetical protein D918_09445 [Trichuris suis]
MTRSDRGNLGRIVYSAGKMSKLIRFIKVFSLSTTSIAFLMQPFIWQDILSGPDRTTLLTTLTLSSLSVLVMCSPLVLNLLTKRYAICMYYDERSERFTAVSLNLFAQSVLTNFHLTQVRQFDSPFQLANVAVDGHAFLLTSANFVDEAVLTKFKPLLGEEEDEDKMVKKDEDEDGLD